MRRRIGVIVLIGAWLAASSAWATTYVIDKDHSAMSFKIRHLFSRVQGTFDDFEGTFVYVPGQPSEWKADATIQAASIDTRVEKRDAHLRSKDFFDVEPYPTITFKGTHVTEATETGGTLHGVLSIHGVEKPVDLALTIHGVGKDPWGNVRAAATAITTINRKDFGLNWNQVLETGQLLVGEEVEITLEVEGIAKE